MDKEYIILKEIEKNSSITQRELSKKASLSLGSVNILLGKMIKEGLIKIKQIPMNRVLYMLTPKGITEKITKTCNYIKIHYQYISETKEKITTRLMELIDKHGEILMLLHKDEISELVKLAANNLSGIGLLKNEQGITGKCIIVVNNEDYTRLKDHGNHVINILEDL